MKKLLLLILLIITIISSAYTENPNYISGVVVDKFTQETLAGVLLITDFGYTYTDFDGKFFIPSTDTIFVRMISYKDDTIIVNSNKLKIELENKL